MFKIEAYRFRVGVFYARLSLKHNSRKKMFSRLSSAGHTLGKKQNSARFMSNYYVSFDCNFFWSYFGYYFGVTSHFEFSFLLF